MSLPANIMPYLMFFLGCGLLTTLLLRRSHRYFRRNRRHDGGSSIVRVARPKTAWDGSQRDAAAAIDRQKIELHDLTRDASGQLNTKILTLQHLLAQSERQIEQMEALLTRLERAKEEQR